MVGRATRLCPDLFRPGQHNSEFRIFDFCGNMEFFAENPETADRAAAESLSKWLFKARLELVGALDQKDGDAELRTETAEKLRAEVVAMNLENFVIRPQRKLVEVFAKPEAWAAESLTPESKAIRHRHHRAGA